LQIPAICDFDFSEPGCFGPKANRPVAGMEAERKASAMTSPEFNNESQTESAGKQQKSTSSRLLNAPRLSRGI